MIGHAPLHLINTWVCCTPTPGTRIETVILNILEDGKNNFEMYMLWLRMIIFWKYASHDHGKQLKGK